MPVAIDDVNFEIAYAYGALPDRLYLIGQGGEIVFQGAEGPWGFDPGAVPGSLAEDRLSRYRFR